MQNFKTVNTIFFEENEFLAEVSMEIGEIKGTVKRLFSKHPSRNLSEVRKFVKDKATVFGERYKALRKGSVSRFSRRVPVRKTIIECVVHQTP
jgi:hypothetical protein